MRSREARALAESALVRLALHLGDHTDSITVIGGLNADLLTDMSQVPHQGTLDVDLLLQVGLVFDRDENDFGWLQRALTAAGFGLGTEGRGWVWWASIYGAPVRLDVLCDAPDHPGQELALPGATGVCAMNLAGPAPALDDVVLRRLVVDPDDALAVGLPDAAGTTVMLRFAGLGGYVLAKAAAAHHRAEPRDFYDLAFVLIHNTAGGPVEAAFAAVAALPPHPHTDHVGLLRAGLTALGDIAGSAPWAYASQRVADGEASEPIGLAQDAVSAALLCSAEVDRLLG